MHSRVLGRLDRDASEYRRGRAMAVDPIQQALSAE